MEFNMAALISSRIHTVPGEIVNIVSGKLATSAVNVSDAVAIGETMWNNFEKSWPDGFYGTILKKVTTMVVTNKSVPVGEPKVYDMNMQFTTLQHYTRLLLRTGSQIASSAVYCYIFTNFDNGLASAFAVNSRYNSIRITTQFPHTGHIHLNYTRIKVNRPWPISPNLNAKITYHGNVT